MDCGRPRLKLAHTVLICAMALTLGACGGGGDDSGGSVAPPGTIDVTAANQDVLSRAAAVAMLGGFVDKSVGIASSGRSAGSSGGREHIAALAAPVTEACFVSGSTTTTLDDRDGSGSASVGDAITTGYNACREIDSEVTNGTLAVTLTELTRAPLKFRASATLTDLSVASTSSVRSATFNGGFVLNHNEPSAATSTTRVDVDSSLTARVVHPLYDDTLTLQAGYSLTLMYDGATPPGALTGGRTLIEASGRVSSRNAGGTVTVWTQPPNIDYWDVERYPRSGRVLVQGNKGSLMLTILSATSVRLELDADGDAVFESTKDVPWDSLL